MTSLRLKLARTSMGYLLLAVDIHACLRYIGDAVTSKRLAILGVGIVAVVALVTYYPATRIGFVNNDWIYLDRVARWSLPQYLSHYLVPGAESGWYRPLFGIYFLAVYTFFGGNPSAYHWGYVLLHLINGLILFAVVYRMSSQSRVAVTATLLYIGMPIYSKAVFWPSTPDTLAMVFYLGALWFWVDYLTAQKSRSAYLTFIAMLLAFLTKEASMTLPLVLFLVDRLLIRKAASPSVLIRRYTPYVLVWVPYLIMEYALQKSGSYVSLAGYGLGSHMVMNLLDSLAALVFPWRLGSSFGYVSLLIATVAFAWVMVRKESRTLAFLGSVIVLNLAPVIGFPTQWFELRYLYGIAMAAAILFAFLFYWGWEKSGKRKSYAILAAGIVAILLFGNGVGTAEAISDWGEIARQRAVPFRDITRAHPTFPNPTRLFLVDPPTTSVYDLSVMFLLRYGAGVVVDGTDDNQPNRVARLRDAGDSYVYYFDATGKPIEVQVARDSPTYPAPALPADFAASIRLEGYEISSNSLRRGEALALFLYWRTLQRIDEDYTVFVHLVNSDGQKVAAHDSQPHNGKSPTSRWTTGQLIVDSVVLDVAEDVPKGANYRIEVGMYSLSKLERQFVVAQEGKPIADKIVIAPFWIE